MFHPTRRWRLDFANPELKIAIEIEGGIFSGGRHVSPAGFIEDCRKYNEAALLGWMVLRVPASWVDSGEALRYAEYAQRAAQIKENHD
jgi:very-short-patch-repair endonuclease